jgi:hypothetical protein
VLIITQSLFALLVLLSASGRPSDPVAPPAPERPATIETLAAPAMGPSEELSSGKMPWDRTRMPDMSTLD